MSRFDADRPKDFETGPIETGRDAWGSALALHRSERAFLWLALFRNGFGPDRTRREIRV